MKTGKRQRSSTKEILRKYFWKILVWHWYVCISPRPLLFCSYYFNLNYLLPHHTCNVNWYSFHSYQNSSKTDFTRLFFFFLEAGIAIVVAQPDFYEMCGQRSFWITVLYFWFKKKANQMRCTNQHGESVHKHTHTNTHALILQSHILSYCIFCTCVEFMTINSVFEERRQCKPPEFYKNHQKLESVPIDMHAIATRVKIFF